MPVKAHGLGGRSPSYGNEIYGNVFDHHCRGLRIRQRRADVRLLPHHAGCYNEYSSIILGSKGRCNLMGCRIEGETNWHFTRRARRPPTRAQRALQGHPLRQAGQHRRLHDPQHDDRRDRPAHLLHRQGSHLGPGDEVEFRLPAQARRCPPRHGAAGRVRRGMAAIIRLSPGQAARISFNQFTL